MKSYFEAVFGVQPRCLTRAFFNFDSRSIQSENALFQNNWSVGSHCCRALNFSGAENGRRHRLNRDPSRIPAWCRRCGPVARVDRRGLESLHRFAVGPWCRMNLHRRERSLQEAERFGSDAPGLKAA
jgi:hypothetical protein